MSGRDIPPNPGERTPLLASPLGNPPVTRPENRAAVKASNHGRDEEADGAEYSPTASEGTAVAPEYPSTRKVVQLVSILLIGVFVSNADGSILLATHTVISSEFNALSASTWLIISYSLAMAATQSLYGKLSDIYGRRAMVLVAYALFGLGCAGCGVGRTLEEVVLGRVVSGIGGAGMTALVSIIITDLVPLREVARWRSYVNIVATVGRSLGGPVGGALADTIGWRWSFLGQTHLIGLAMLLVWIFLPEPSSHTVAPSKLEDSSSRSKLARIDFLGSFLMASTILLFLFPIELGGSKFAWSDARVWGMLVASAVVGVLFVLTEAYWATEPIFSLRLLRQKDVVLSYVVMAFQTAAQLGMMFTVPLYFQITKKVSFTVAGAHLFPAVAGNAVGGLLAGYLIHRTGRYKALILAAAILSGMSYLLLILRWNGHTGLLESLYIIPGGFGTGIAMSALFISLQAVITPSQTAIATSALYLSSTIGMTLGLAGAGAVEQGVLRVALERKLSAKGFGAGKRKRIIERSVGDLTYVGKLKGELADLVISSYLEGLDSAHAVSLGCSCIAFVSGFFLSEKSLA